MVIFNSYVKLPEGKCEHSRHFSQWIHRQFFLIKLMSASVRETFADFPAMGTHVNSRQFLL
jgi:uncharacterized membrane-anchored protein